MRLQGGRSDYTGGIPTTSPSRLLEAVARRHPTPAALAPRPIKGAVRARRVCGARASRQPLQRTLPLQRTRPLYHTRPRNRNQPLQQKSLGI